MESMLSYLAMQIYRDKQTFSSYNIAKALLRIHWPRYRLGLAASYALQLALFPSYASYYTRRLPNCITDLESGGATVRAQW